MTIAQPDLGVGITLAHYAWASEEQHRGKIRQIRCRTRTVFETTAREIDKKTGCYFIGRTCGSSVNALPATSCPVCGLPRAHYRDVEPPA